MFMITTEKAIERNKDIIKKLDEYIDTHDDIQRIVTSIELTVLLSALEEGTVRVRCHEFNEPDYDFVNYKGIRVVKDEYYPAQKLGFVHRNTNIEFDLSCDCSEIQLR